MAARNRYAAPCDRCGYMLHAGEGVLRRCGGSDTGCRVRDHYDNGGWHVTHVDRAVCDRLRAEALAAAAADRARAEAIERAVAEVDPEVVGSPASDGDRVPPDAVSLAARVGEVTGRMWRGMAGSRDILVATDAVYAVSSSYDDAPRLWVCRDPDVVARARALAGGELAAGKTARP